MNKVKIYHNIATYLKAKQDWINTPAEISNGRMTIGGEEAKEWRRNNPEPVYEPKPRVNPNGQVNLAGVLIER